MNYNNLAEDRSTDDSTAEQADEQELPAKEVSSERISYPGQIPEIEELKQDQGAYHEDAEQDTKARSAMEMYLRDMGRYAQDSDRVLELYWREYACNQELMKAKLLRAVAEKKLWKHLTHQDPEVERAHCDALGPEAFSELMRPYDDIVDVLQEVKDLASERVRKEVPIHNLRLVVHQAKKFKWAKKYGMYLEDLIAEGNIGLLASMDKFDVTRGYKFSTYATWWVRHSIQRAIADKGKGVRIPVHIRDAYSKAFKAENDLRAKTGRDPTLEEISRASGFPVKKLRIAYEVMQPEASLDNNIGDEGPGSFLDYEEGDAGDPIKKDILRYRVQELLDMMNGQLQPIERDILYRRFGLIPGENYGEEETLKEVGDSYNLSRERVRQLQVTALDKVRRMHGEEMKEIYLELIRLQ